MSTDKEQAKRLADALENSPLTAGLPHSHQAAALLRRWPDGDPVGYLPAYELDRLQSGHDGRLRSAKLGPSYLDGDVAVYTAPPADAERIAALEAALEQARVALERIRHATAPTHDDGGHHEAAHDLSIDALRAIEEVRRG